MVHIKINNYADDKYSKNITGKSITTPTNGWIYSALLSDIEIAE